MYVIRSIDNLDQTSTTTYFDDRENEKDSYLCCVEYFRWASSRWKVPIVLEGKHYLPQQIDIQSADPSIDQYCSVLFATLRL